MAVDTAFHSHISDYQGAVLVCRQSKCSGKVAYREVDAEEDAACRADELCKGKEQGNGKAFDLWGQRQRKHHTQRP